MGVYYDNSTFPRYRELMNRHARGRRFKIATGTIVTAALIVAYLALPGGYPDLRYYVVLPALLVLLLFALIASVMDSRKERGTIVVSSRGLQLDHVHIERRALLRIQEGRSGRFILVTYTSGGGRERTHLLDKRILCDEEAFVDSVRRVWPSDVLALGL
jgi:hypothetical protein